MCPPTRKCAPNRRHSITPSTMQMCTHVQGALGTHPHTHTLVAGLACASFSLRDLHKQSPPANLQTNTKQPTLALANKHTQEWRWPPLIAQPTLQAAERAAATNHQGCPSHKWSYTQRPNTRDIATTLTRDAITTGHNNYNTDRQCCDKSTARSGPQLPAASLISKDRDCLLLA